MEDWGGKRKPPRSEVENWRIPKKKKGFKGIGLQKGTRKNQASRNEKSLEGPLSGKKKLL